MLCVENSYPCLYVVPRGIARLGFICLHCWQNNIYSLIFRLPPLVFVQLAFAYLRSQPYCSLCFFMTPPCTESHALFHIIYPNNSHIRQALPATSVWSRVDSYYTVEIPSHRNNVYHNISLLHTSTHQNCVHPKATSTPEENQLQGCLSCWYATICYDPHHCIASFSLRKEKRNWFLLLRLAPASTILPHPTLLCNALEGLEGTWINKPALFMHTIRLSSHFITLRCIAIYVT